MKVTSRLRTSVDHTEQVAVGVSQNYEVCTFGIVPIDSHCTESYQSLDLGKLLLLICCPEVKVCAVLLVEVQPWPVCCIWYEEVGVGRSLIAQRLAPESGCPASVGHLQDNRSNADHGQSVRRVHTTAVEALDAPSLYEKWLVRHVIAHMMMPTRLTAEQGRWSGPAGRTGCWDGLQVGGTGSGRGPRYFGLGQAGRRRLPAILPDRS